MDSNGCELALCWLQVLQLSSDYFSVLEPKRVQGSILSTLAAPLDEQMLRTYWRLSERVLALDSSPEAGTALSVRKLKEDTLEAAAHIVALGVASNVCPSYHSCPIRRTAVTDCY